MRTAVLLSGGVDSSVALRLVQEQGQGEIIAFYLKIWLEDELAFLGDCPWEEDLSYARAVCAQAGVPLQVVALQTEYQERVVAYALDELRRGRTPSPDILCNQFIKFGLFFEKLGPDFDWVVSGHYARVEEQEGQFWLKRSPDRVKDQTYFLSRLSQQQLARIRFPIGHLTKSEVRKLADRWELPNRARKDSQGICFLGKISYPRFVQFHLGEREGEVIDVDTDRVLGRHKGVWFHTIGQRQGLGLGGGPWYVVRKDLQSNRLYVAHAVRYRTHARACFTIADVHWITTEPAAGALQTRLRHSPHLEDCVIRRLETDRWEVRLECPDQGVAPGQSAVFYSGETCLGVGTID